MVRGIVLASSQLEGKRILHPQHIHRWKTKEADGSCAGGKTSEGGDTQSETINLVEVVVDDHTHTEGHRFQCTRERQCQHRSPGRDKT